jgi:hypothetical protein
MPHRFLTVAAFLPLLGTPALGQDAFDPTQPGPTTPAVPGLEQTDHRIQPPQLLREGSFIVRRRGSMVRLPGGEWAFIFHRDAAGFAERPMVLIPNQTLQRMEQSAGSTPEQAIFSVTGEVFAYRGVNYLLATAAAVEPAPAPPHSESRQQPEAPPPPASPDVQDLIRQLEAQRERPRTIDPGMQMRPGAAPAPAGPAGRDLIPEGRTIIRRTGRMVRSSAGDWMMVFDVGTQTDPALDRPLLLVPSLALQQMEPLAARAGDGQNIEVSGRVLLYQGRNYLIPTLFQAQSSLDLRPRQ